MIKKVAIYIRVSTKKQEKEGLSLDAQKRLLEEYTLNNKWEIYKDYCDGVSGKSISGRKYFKEMLKDAKEGKFSTILITKLDRAFRNVKEALITLDELNSIGVDFVSISEKIDTTSAMGRFFFTIISAFAELERELVKERVDMTKLDKFNRGVATARSPIGYKFSKANKMIVPDKDAEKIKEIFKMTLNKINWKEICSKFKINSSTYYNIIKNPMYAGYIRFDKQIKMGNHQPLINQEDFKKLNPNFKHE